MKDLVVDTETTNKNPHKAKMLGYSLYEDGKSYYVNDSTFCLSEHNNSNIIAHNGKYDAVVFSKNQDVDIWVSFDTMVAYYLLHIDRPRKLEKIVEDLFGRRKDDLLCIYNKYSGDTRELKNLPEDWFTRVPEEVLAMYAQEDAKETYNIYQYCKKEFEKKPILKAWFHEVEMPLTNILVQSELKGAKIDLARLRELECKWKKQTYDLSNRLRVMADNEDLNLNSPKQLQEVLYKKLKLPKLIKTKTGWSTRTLVLERIKHNSGFVRKLLEHRHLEHMLSSFVLPLQEQAGDDGRIHPTFNQALTVTRRFSCKDPNLQQIPRRTEVGQEIRKCFIPAKDHKFVILDYSQIELRLLAHFSKDENLLKAFLDEDKDIHSYTSSLMYDIPIGEVTPEQRDVGKTINFSILYGKTAYGFAQDWNCTQDEAQEKIDLWFKQFPRVKKYLEDQKMIGRNNRGWIKSIAGLPLFIKDVNSNKTREFEGAGRQIVNYKIQSSSQDIIKKAIVEIYNQLNIFPILMVHDELVYELHDSLLHDSKKLGGISKSFAKVTCEIMENVWKLEVPVKVDYKISDRWEK